MRKIILGIALLIGIMCNAQQAETSKNHFFNTNIDYQIRANFSIGGSTPIGIPREIRKIESYNPMILLGAEINTTKWFSDEKIWGIRLGIRSERKGMETKAQVKNYITEIEKSGEKIRGYYTGMVKTEVINSYISLPISVVYRISDRWNLYAGGYFSRAIYQQFKGSVSEGYLRQDTPIGAKISFEQNEQAKYDFSDKIQKTEWGALLGAEWYLNDKFCFFPEITYSFNSLLNPNFEAISFSLHNVYLNLGFGYSF